MEKNWVMKREKLVKMNLEGLNFDYTVYLNIKKGLSPVEIAGKYKMSKQRIDYYIQRLKRNGLIEKVGRKAWNVLKKVSQNEPKDTPLYLRYFLTNSRGKKGLKLAPDSVRGHAFAFVLKLPKVRNWDRRVEWLRREKVLFKRVGFGGLVQSFVFKNFTVWLGSKSVTVYFPRWKHYFEDTAVEAYNFVIYDYIALIKALERFLGCNFKIMNEYKFRPSKQHYALIKNSLAKQYNRAKKKLHVYDEGGLWLLIDDSFGLKELEAVHKDTAVPDNKEVQDVFNSGKKTGLDFYDVRTLQVNEKEIFDRVKGLSENLANLSVVLEQNNDVLKKVVLKIQTNGRWTN